MNKSLRLGLIADYSENRIKSENVSLDNYITIDNILQNKAGITKAINLPPNGDTMPEYNTGNILVGNIRPYLKKIWFADRDGGCSSDVLVFKVKKDNYPKFIYYALFRDDFFNHMMRGKKGTKMPRGDKDQILDFLIPDFSFNSQQKISSVLSSLDSKIAINNRINYELEKIAKTIYDYWFVQFDFPDENGRPYKSSGGKMVWNDELKRDIPKGWEYTTIGNVYEVLKGDIVTEKTIKKGNIKVVAGGLEYAYFHSISNREENTITISGSGANAGYVNFWRDKIFASDCTTVRGKSVIETIIAYYYLKLIQNQIYRYSQGSAQPHVYPTDIKNLPFVIAPSKIYESIESLLIPMNKKIMNIENENKKLSDLRDWLLPMLMNGQVKVK